jgi:hypothetical protein
MNLKNFKEALKQVLEKKGVEERQFFQALKDGQN